MTHGEAWYLNKQRLQEIPSLNLEDELQKIKLPPKMNKEDAVRYYNKKMFDYYVAELKAKAPMRVKKALVSRDMFRDWSRYNEFEDLKNDTLSKK